jgi:hypothetical protein
MIAAIARRLAADIGPSAGKGGAAVALGLSDKAWLVGYACRCRGSLENTTRAAELRGMKCASADRQGEAGRAAECSDCYRDVEILLARGQ